jgi:ElaB/YqjD/DUF883 family membrane-anchored ribosome-binding protein
MNDNKSKDGFVQQASQKGAALVSELNASAHQMANDIENRADGAVHEVGQKIVDAAHQIGQHTSAKSSAHIVAEQMESSGKYLTDHGVRDFAADSAELVQRHPFTSVALSFGVGLGIGVLAGWLMGSKR